MMHELLDVFDRIDLHPAGEVLGVAGALAREIADNAAPVSVALSRQLLWRMKDLPDLFPDWVDPGFG